MGSRTVEKSVSAARSIRWSLGLVLLAFVVDLPVRGADPAAQPVASTLSPPVQLTREQDHQRIMDLLHITSLRRGADGRNAKAANAANYDESKANPYPSLPEPLVLKDGQKVTTAEMWVNKRRPEIVADFDAEIYGRVPKE